MICYRAGHEIGELDWEKRRESKDLKLAYLLGWPICFCVELDWWFPREGLLELGAGITGRGKKIFVTDLPDSL